jgi:hypothetical protein
MMAPSPVIAGELNGNVRFSKERRTHDSFTRGRNHDNA